jgi:hypothetical protein
MSNQNDLTCKNCGNKSFDVAPEFDFDNNFIAPICRKCSTLLSKDEYIRQAQDALKNIALAAFKDFR